MSAAEAQRTQCDKEPSGNRITTNPIVDIVIFGIRIRIHYISALILVLRVEDSWFAKSKSV